MKKMKFNLPIYSQFDITVIITEDVGKEATKLVKEEWSVVIDNTLNSNQVYWNKVVGYQEARQACLEKLIEIVERENTKVK